MDDAEERRGSGSYKLTAGCLGPAFDVNGLMRNTLQRIILQLVIYVCPIISSKLSSQDISSSYRSMLKVNSIDFLYSSWNTRVSAPITVLF